MDLANKKPPPRVSVILPSYNDADFLPGAIDSVLNQTWKDLELIVVNDGSTDHTKDVLAAYQHDPRVIVIHKNNEKLPRALNTGFENARGEYLTWTSADNFMLPQMLERLVNTLDSSPDIALVYADWQVIDDAGDILGVVKTLDYDHHLLMRVNYINACFLYRRECQETIGLYDPQYSLAEDWEYWWRISQHFTMQRVPEVLYQYRVHKGSLSHFIKVEQGGVSTGYRKLEQDFRANRVQWYWSKIKYELLKLRRGETELIKPITEG